MRLHRRSLLSGIAGAALLGAARFARADSIDEPALVDRLATALVEAEREADFSGAVRLMHRDRVVFETAVGLASRVYGTPNAIDTRFNIASMGKMFTAVAVLRLWQEGRLDLDAPLLRCLPDYPVAEVAGRITPRQLLSHSSGMGNYWQAVQVKPSNAFVETADYLRVIRDERPSFQPGERFGYSNSGYVLLGLAIEALTGETFAQHIDRTIFQPLDMAGSGYWPIDLVVPNRAEGYVRDPKTPGAWRSNVMANIYRGSPAGGGYSTVGDLTTFLAALRDHRLLTPETTTLATTGLFDMGKARYGLGFMDDRVNRQRVIGHTGGHDGIAGEAWCWPDHGWSFVMLTNGEVDGYWRINATVRDLLCGPSPSTAGYHLAMDMVRAARRDDVEAARAIYAARPQGLQPRAVFEVEAAKARHRGDGQAASRIMQAAALVDA